MNPSEYRLSREVLEDMAKDRSDKIFNRFETHFNSSILGESLGQKNMNLLYEIYQDGPVSTGLKKLHSEYLANANKNCYPDKHIDDSFTNAAKIKECRDLERQKLFGKFESHLHRVRDSSRFQLSECLRQSNSTVEKGFNCLEKYNNDIKNDNAKILAQFKIDYPKYV